MPRNLGGLRPSTTNSPFTASTISFSDTGDNTVISGTANQTIRVWRLFFIVSADTNITLKDGTGTNLTGQMTMFAGGSFVLEYNEEPWFITSAGNGFVINQSGTAQISGRIEYDKS